MEIAISLLIDISYMHELILDILNSDINIGQNVKD